MPTITPAELLAATNPGSRWRIQRINSQDSLYTPLLGSTLTGRVRVDPARLATPDEAATATLTVTTIANQHPLSPPQSWALRVNHGPWHRFAAGQPIQLAVPDGALVTLMTAGNCDLDQVWDGGQGFALASLAVDGGSWEPAPVTPRVTVIGDSITAGCWVAGRTASADYRPEANYLALAADQLGWPIDRVAYSAAGFCRPGTGGVPAAIDWLTRIDANHPAPALASPWVVVALGVNDRRFPENQVTQAIQDYCAALAEYFPGNVALMVPFAQSFAPQLRTVAATHGWPVIETAGWDYTTGDGLHPDAAGSQALAQHFAAALQALITKG